MRAAWSPCHSTTVAPLAPSASNARDGSSEISSFLTARLASSLSLRHRCHFQIPQNKPGSEAVPHPSGSEIPSIFSIRLVDDPDSADDLGSKNRRLLNMEKIIFKAESSDPVYVLVTVEPEGVAAKPNVPERDVYMSEEPQCQLVATTAGLSAPSTIGMSGGTE